MPTPEIDHPEKNPRCGSMQCAQLGSPPLMVPLRGAVSQADLEEVGIIGLADIAPLLRVRAPAQVWQSAAIAITKLKN